MMKKNQRIKKKTLKMYYKKNFYEKYTTKRRWNGKKNFFGDCALKVKKVYLKNRFKKEGSLF